MPTCEPKRSYSFTRRCNTREKTSIFLEELRQIIKEHSTGYKPTPNPVSEAVERFNKNYAERNGRKLGR